MRRINPSATRPYGSLPSIAALTALCLAPALPAIAQDAGGPEKKYGGWFEIRAGWGQVERDSASSGPYSANGAAIDIAGGLRLGSHWLVGLEVGGLTVEPYDTYEISLFEGPDHGEGLSNVFAVAQYHNALTGGWLLHAGAGWSDYTDYSPDGYLYDGGGWGAELGCGYEWRMTERGALLLLARYELGNISPDAPNAGPDYDYSALKISVSWAYR